MKIKELTYDDLRKLKLLDVENKINDNKLQRYIEHQKYQGTHVILRGWKNEK